uniref:Meis_PKNOX_N domain-containing protein n=1 Tax=Steinernema glaseri TaxID=37863 RepID=A0A1I8A1J7_9BILA
MQSLKRMSRVLCIMNNSLPKTTSHAAYETTPVTQQTPQVASGIVCTKGKHRQMAICKFSFASFGSLKFGDMRSCLCLFMSCFLMRAHLPHGLLFSVDVPEQNVTVKMTEDDAFRLYPFSKCQLECIDIMLAEVKCIMQQSYNNLAALASGDAPTVSGSSSSGSSSTSQPRAFEQLALNTISLGSLSQLEAPETPDANLSIEGDANNNRDHCLVDRSFLTDQSSLAHLLQAAHKCTQIGVAAVPTPPFIPGGSPAVPVCPQGLGDRASPSAGPIDRKGAESSSPLIDLFFNYRKDLICFNKLIIARLLLRR